MSHRRLLGDNTSQSSGSVRASAEILKKHPVRSTIKLNRTLVAINVDGTVHLMLELAAPAAVAAERAPIDVVVVLDRSGSMGGDPMHVVREATCNLLRLLGPDDRLGVVAFDDEVQLVLPLSSHDIDAACSKVRQIEAGGSTNLSGGWLKGFEILSAHARPEAVSRIIVLTDGHANEGITDPVQLCTMARAARDQIRRSQRRPSALTRVTTR